MATALEKGVSHMVRVNVLAALLLAFACSPVANSAPVSVRLPSGFSITPLAAPGADLQRLPTLLRPDGSADGNGANTAVLSPDGSALLVLTSGFNTYFYTGAAAPITHAVLDPVTGQPSTVTTQNAEWIFLYDVRSGTPVLKQRLPLPNTYHGAVWAPDGRHFYISAGIDDRVYVYATQSTGLSAASPYAPDAPFILLGHNTGQRQPLPNYNGGMFHGTPVGKTPALISAVGGSTSAVAAGLALSADGKTLAVVNMQSDSVSLVDTQNRRVSQEIRFFVPGQQAAVGELPYWAAIRSGAKGAFARAYVSSQRDGQVLSVGTDGTFNVITVGGEPNRMVLSADQRYLYVANGDLDEVEVIDTGSETVVRRLSMLRPGYRFLGAGPSGLKLSPDGGTLYVTLDNENALAVVDLRTGVVSGRIPTGWFPADVAVSADGSHLFVVNAKGVSGPSNYTIYYRKNDNQKIPPNGYHTACRTFRASRQEQQFCQPDCRSDDGFPAHAYSPCYLYPEGKPHLRSGSRRSATRRWRAKTVRISAREHTQSPRPCRTVRSARQFHERRRCQRRRLELDVPGPRQHLYQPHRAGWLRQCRLRLPVRLERQSTQYRRCPARSRARPTRPGQCAHYNVAGPNGRFLDRTRRERCRGR
jgi:YVTN family beta-propeller protein